MLINNKTLEEDSPLVYTNTTTLALPAQNLNNSGSPKMGAGDKYVLVIYEQFDYIFGYTQCDYKSYISSEDKRTCLSCEEGSYSLDAKPTQCYTNKEFLTLS